MSLSLRLVVSVCMGTALSTPVWAINKCVGVDGKVTFQDAACVGPGNENTPSVVKPQAPVFVPKTPRPPMGDEEYERKRAEIRMREIDEFGKSRGAALRAYIDADIAKCGPTTHDPHVGASANWIRTCSNWGDPDEIHSTTTALGKTEQWVYRHRGYIYFDARGIVTAIQK